MSKNVRTILRTTLGIFLIAYALNKFLHVIPTGYGEMNETTQDFLDGVAVYLPYLYIFEIIVGLFLVLNKWSAFILIVLFPLSISFLIFGISNGDFAEFIPALIVALLNVILLYAHWDKFKPLFTAS